MSDLRKFRELGGADRRLLAFCLVAAPCFALAVRTIGFGRTRSLLQLWPRSSGGAGGPARAAAIARLVGIASARSPVTATCLPRSLLLWWLLRCHGIECALRIGVLREPGSFGAHAWVEHAGRPLGDEELWRRYVPFEKDFGAIAGPVS